MLLPNQNLQTRYLCYKHTKQIRTAAVFAASCVYITSESDKLYLTDPFVLRALVTLIQIPAACFSFIEIFSTGQTHARTVSPACIAKTSFVFAYPHTIFQYCVLRVYRDSFLLCVCVCVPAQNFVSAVEESRDHFLTEALRSNSHSVLVPGGLTSFSFCPVGLSELSREVEFVSLFSVCRPLET